MLPFWRLLPNWKQGREGLKTSRHDTQHTCGNTGQQREQERAVKILLLSLLLLLLLHVTLTFNVAPLRPRTD